MAAAAKKKKIATQKSAPQKAATQKVAPQRAVADNKSYSAESIKVLKGLTAVRRRPGMYIGDTDDGSGLHHMVYEVVDNAIDEALAGFCSEINITLNEDGSLTVRDNGRGIPIDMHKGEGMSAAEVIMTQLHAGGKFDESSYKISGGLHGVGVSVVNALSEWLQAHIWRDNKEYMLRFQDGKTIKSLSECKGKDKSQTSLAHGTQVTFLPSPEVFSMIKFDYNTLLKRFRELAFLNAGLKIILNDKRAKKEKKEELFYQGGVSAFVKYLDRNRKPCLASLFFSPPKKMVLALKPL